MSDIERLISYTILSKTLENIQENPLKNIGCTVGLINQDDIYKWKCTLRGPNDSPYKGGFYKVFIYFPVEFPMKPPEVVFDTPIFHLNVNPIKTQDEKLGHCCISTINYWIPETSIEDILVSIFGLFYAANEESAYRGYGDNVIEEFIHDRKKYNMRVKYFTEKYANGMHSSENVERWDFSYDKNE